MLAAWCGKAPYPPAESGKAERPRKWALPWGLDLQGSAKLQVNIMFNNKNIDIDSRRLFIDNRLVSAASVKEGLGSSCRAPKSRKGRRAKSNPLVGTFVIISRGGKPV